MGALITAFGVVFLAELGDKSMLFSLTAATRYRWWVVLLPVVLATAALTALAVVLGSVLAGLLPERAVALLAAGLFVGFGVWMLLEGEEADEEAVDAGPRAPLQAMAMIGTVFFLAELGDKTQIATMSLAGLHEASPVLVWAGATAGLVATNALAIALGQRARHLLPQRVLHVLAAAVFIVTGVVAGILALR